MSKGKLVFAFALTIAIIGCCTSVWAVSWPVATPCSLLTTYGQYQNPTLYPSNKYLHDGLDILASVGTNSRAVEPLFIQWKLIADTSLDTVYCGVGLGNGVSRGWIYFHLSKGYLENHLQIRDSLDELDTVAPISGGGPSWITHLHFMMVEGHPCAEDQWPYKWDENPNP